MGSSMHQQAPPALPPEPHSKGAPQRPQASRRTDSLGSDMAWVIVMPSSGGHVVPLKDAVQGSHSGDRIGADSMSRDGIAMSVLPTRTLAAWASIAAGHGRAGCPSL